MSSSRDRTASGAASVAFIGHFSQLLKNLHFLFCASNLNCLCGRLVTPPRCSAQAQY